METQTSLVAQDRLEEKVGSREMSQNVPQCPTCAVLVDGLNDRQRNALELMLAGMSDAATAQQLGIDRRTIYRWRREHDAFKEALHQRRRELWDGVVDKMRAMLEPSLEVLSEHLHDSLDRNRYRAAVSILRLSNVRGAIPVTDKEGPERARH